MDNTNPISENRGLIEGTSNIVDNVHNKNTTQRTEKEAPSARKDNQLLCLIRHPTCC